MGRMGIAIKRIYEEPTASDGYRVLVDRLWPRGMTKERAALDLWLKDVAPSPLLRKWFSHDPAKFAEFRMRYIAELDANAAVDNLAPHLRGASRRDPALCRQGPAHQSRPRTARLS